MRSGVRISSRGEYRQNLGVEIFELAAAEGNWKGWQSGDPLALELEENQNGNVPAISLRVSADLLQGVDQSGYGGAKVDIRHVDDFQARLTELAACIRVGAGIFAEPADDLRAAGSANSLPSGSA